MTINGRSFFSLRRFPLSPQQSAMVVWCKKKHGGRDFFTQKTAPRDFFGSAGGTRRMDRLGDGLPRDIPYVCLSFSVARFQLDQHDQSLIFLIAMMTYVRDEHPELVNRAITPSREASYSRKVGKISEIKRGTSEIQQTQE